MADYALGSNPPYALSSRAHSRDPLAIAPYGLKAWSRWNYSGRRKSSSRANVYRGGRPHHRHFETPHTSSLVGRGKAFESERRWNHSADRGVGISSKN